MRARERRFLGMNPGDGGVGYPLKLLRDFHLIFHVRSRDSCRESGADSDGAAGIGDDRLRRRYVHGARDIFRAGERTGAVISFEVETEQPLEIEARFIRDFQLEWPAALGGTFIEWDSGLHAFALGEETQQICRRSSVRRPAGEPGLEYRDELFRLAENSIRLGVTKKGKDRKLIVISGSMNGHAEAEADLSPAARGPRRTAAGSAKYYQKYLQRHSELSCRTRSCSRRMTGRA